MIGVHADFYRRSTFGPWTESIRTIATVPGCEIAFAVGAGPDKRNYRACFGKILDALQIPPPEGVLARQASLQALAEEVRLS